MNLNRQLPWWETLLVLAGVWGWAASGPAERLAGLLAMLAGLAILRAACRRI